MSDMAMYHQLAFLPVGTKPLGFERSTPDREDAKENRERCEDKSVKPVRIKHISSPQQRGESYANHGHACKSRDDAG